MVDERETQKKKKEEKGGLSMEIANMLTHFFPFFPFSAV